MKRIKLIAQNYGEAFGADRAIRDLIARKMVSGVSVMAASELWPREAMPLVDLLPKAGGRIEVGMMICLSKPFKPVSHAAREKFPEGFPSVAAIRMRNRMSRGFRRLLAAEIAAQLDQFERHFFRPPDFLDGWQDVHETTAVRQALMHMIERMERPMPSWIRAARPGKLLDRWRQARLGKLVIRTSPDTMSIPAGLDEEKLSKFFFSAVERLPDETVLTVRPSEYDERVRRNDRRYKEREWAYRFMTSPDFERVLNRKEIYLF